MYRRRLQ